jgi:hypothetical protein
MPRAARRIEAMAQALRRLRAEITAEHADPLAFRDHPLWRETEETLVRLIGEAGRPIRISQAATENLSSAGSEVALRALRGICHLSGIPDIRWDEIMGFADDTYISALIDAGVEIRERAFTAILRAHRDHPRYEGSIAKCAPAPCIVLNLLSSKDLQELRDNRPDLIERVLCILKAQDPVRDWVEDLQLFDMAGDEWSFAVLWLLLEPTAPMDTTFSDNVFIRRIGMMTSAHERMKLAAELGSVGYLLRQPNIAPSSPEFVRADAGATATN